MKLNNWLGLLFHTIIVALCGALIWAMNYFASDWGFMYDHIAVKIVITLVPVLLYWIFAKILPGRAEKSRDFTSGMAILIIGLVVFGVAMFGFGGDLTGLEFGESMWTLPMDVFLLPAILVLSVWGLGYNIIGLVASTILPTIIFGISRKVSRIGREEEYEEVEEEEELDKEDILEEPIEARPAEEVQETVAADANFDQTIQWKKDSEETESKVDGKTQAVPVVEPKDEVKVTAPKIGGETLTQEEIEMILAARAQRRRQEGITEEEALEEEREEVEEAIKTLNEEGQEEPETEDLEKGPFEKIEDRDEEQAKEEDEEVQPVIPVAPVLEAEDEREEEEKPVPIKDEQKPVIDESEEEKAPVVEEESEPIIAGPAVKEAQDEVINLVEEDDSVEVDDEPSALVVDEVPAEDRAEDFIDEMGSKENEEIIEEPILSVSEDGFVETIEPEEPEKRGLKPESKAVQDAMEMTDRELDEETKAKLLKSGFDVDKYEYKLDGYDKAVDYDENHLREEMEKADRFGEYNVPGFLRKDRREGMEDMSSRRAKRESRRREVSEEDAETEEAWEETKDTFRNIFGSNRTRSRSRDSRDSRKRRSGSRRSRSTRPEESRSFEEPKFEIEWRSSQRDRSSLKRPDYGDITKKSFESGEENAKDILFEDENDK